MTKSTAAEIDQELQELVGHLVRVCIVPDAFTRNGFGPQIAVAGELECKRGEDGKHHYRVLVDDDCFSYFTVAQVVWVNPLASITTVYLSIPVDTEQG